MANGKFGGGTGSISDPYFIEDADDFYEIRNNSNRHFRLVKGINLSECSHNGPTGWSPIPLFSGSLDGQGNIISGLYINSNSSGNSMIDNLEGQIYNLQIINAHVKGNLSTSILTSSMNTDKAIIENCHVTGNIFGVHSGSIRGGIVFNIGGGLINNCSVMVNFDEISSHNGGIVFDSSYTIGTVKTPIIRNSYYYGTGGYGVANRTTNECSIINSFYNSNKPGNSSGIYKTEEEIKQSLTYINWTDKENILQPTWVIADGSLPILYYNSTDLFVIYADGNYYSIKNNEITKISDILPTKDQFITNGISSPEISNIPGNIWNKFRSYNEVKLVSMSDKNKINKVYDSHKLILDSQTSNGFLYKTAIDLSQYENLGKIYFGEEE